jgi:hypothetical protein
VLVIRLGMLLGAMTLVAWTTADPDLWGHVRFGLDTLRDHSLTAKDPYSFTSDRSWVNHEWLAEVVMAGSYRLDGARGLVALKLLIVSLTVGLVVAALRHRTWDPISHDLLVGTAIFGIFGRVHPVRPQLFSVLFCAGLLLLLSEADRGRRRLLALVPILMALWANLHGGYLVGLGIIGIWVSVRLYQTDPQGLPQGRLVLFGIAALLGTLLTPYGVQLWLFLRETVGVSREGIGDWQMLWETDWIVIVQWLVVTVVAGLALTRGRADLADILIPAFLCLATLMVSRFDAFYALAVVMLLGPCLGGTAALRPLPTSGRAMALAAFAAVAAVGMLAERSSCIEIRTAPEPEATAYASRLNGRMVTFFDWGEYAIWHLAPAIHVSIDGRRETVYSDAMTRSHIRIYTNAPEAVELVEALQPDWIWFPRQWVVNSRLEAAGWHVAFRGPVSVILGRKPGAFTEVQTDIARRCFPGY